MAKTKTTTTTTTTNNTNTNAAALKALWAKAQAAQAAKAAKAAHDTRNAGWRAQLAARASALPVLSAWLEAGAHGDMPAMPYTFAEYMRDKATPIAGKANTARGTSHAGKHLVPLPVHNYLTWAITAQAGSFDGFCATWVNNNPGCTQAELQAAIDGFYAERPNYKARKANAARQISWLLAKNAIRLE